MWQVSMEYLRWILHTNMIQSLLRVAGLTSEYFCSPGFANVLKGKNIGTSIKVGCATQSVRELRSKGWRSPDLQLKGTGIRTLSPLRRFRQGPSYSPNRLVSQSATLNSYWSTKLPEFSVVHLNLKTIEYVVHRYGTIIKR